MARAVDIIRGHRDAPLVVVVSALAGVTDALLEIATRAVQGDAEFVRAGAAAVRARHVAAAEALLAPGPRRDELLRLSDEAFAELEQIAAGLVIVRELTARTTDYLVARGERLSARLFAAALGEAGPGAVQFVDALEVVKSDGTFGHASPDLARTDRAARKVLGPLLARGAVPVVPGFLAATPDGQVATLGRGGSDLTATLLGRALGARDVALWKDVPGLLTADPRVVPDARVVPQLHVREAAELAYYGAKVLYPRALIPLGQRNIAIRIRSFADPSSPGTEIARREIDGVEVRPGVATLVVVGLGMAGTPGIAARVFGALAQAGINVIAIAQGSSELNISVVVDARDAARAQRMVHDAFQLSKIGGGAMTRRTRTDVMLLGFGQIGRALAAMIAKLKREPLAVKVVAAVDRSGFVFDARGLSAPRLAALAAAKASGTPLAKAPGGRKAGAREALDFAARHALANPILVDVTADDTSDTLKQALAAGMHLVLANKRPLTVHRKLYDELRALAEERGRRLLHETTVGAGLPIIDTYYKLVESGDRVQKIEGCPSGTLGYLFGELGRGRRFSEALRGAIAKGYPEPDPRDDLCGMDVARKALILGRLLGFPGELEDIEVESLVPEEARGLPLEEFLRRLDEGDEPWRRRTEEARARRGRLRHRCLLQPGARRFRPTAALPYLPRPARAPPPRAPNDARRAASAARLALGRPPRPARLGSVALSRAGAAGGRRLRRQLPRGQHAAARPPRRRRLGRRPRAAPQARRAQPHRLLQGPRHDRRREPGAAGAGARPLPWVGPGRC